MLSFYVTPEHNNWDTLLPYLTFAYNTAVQSTTQYSPFILLYGYDSVCTVDTSFSYASHFDNETLAEATCRAEECRQIARCPTYDAQASANLRYDEQHHHVDCDVGHLVLLWVPIRKPGLSEKLICQYVGSYLIVRRLAPVTYVVSPVHPSTDRRRRSTESAHVTRLKPYICSLQQPGSN